MWNSYSLGILTRSTKRYCTVWTQTCRLAILFDTSNFLESFSTHGRWTPWGHQGGRVWRVHHRQTCRRSTFWIDFRLRGLPSRFRLESADGGETLFAEFGSFEFECDMLSQLSQTYKFQVDMIWFLSRYHYIVVNTECLLFWSPYWGSDTQVHHGRCRIDILRNLQWQVLASHPIIQNHHAAHRSSTADRWMGSKPTPWNCEEKKCGSWQMYAPLHH